jgi:hypothetical protein
MGAIMGVIERVAGHEADRPGCLVDLRPLLQGPAEA